VRRDAGQRRRETPGKLPGKEEGRKEKTSAKELGKRLFGGEQKGGQPKAKR